MKFRKIIAYASSLFIAAGCISSGYDRVYAYGDHVSSNEYSMDIYPTDYNIQDENGEDIEVYGIYNFSSTTQSDTVVIPSAYEGKQIRLMTTLDNISAENIILPSHLMFINSKKFLSGCTNLKNIVVPDTVIEAEGLNIPSNVTIIGCANSYAEYYANKNSNKFRLLGDMNGDGKISTIDLVTEMQHILGLRETEGTDRLAGDLSMDGKINNLDLIMIKNNILEPLKDISGSVSGLAAAPDLKKTKRSDVKADADGFVKFTADFSDNVLLDTKNENEGKNPVYSPISIYMALSALAECSDTQTLDELLTALHAENKDELRKSNKEIFESLYFDDFLAYSRITNSIWLDDGYVFEDDCLQRLADDYYSAVFVRNLGSAETCDDISNWIYQNTSGKFKPEIEPNVEDIIKIINTVTFKEKWQNSFVYSSEGMFTCSDGTTVSCQMMDGGHDYSGRYYEGKDYTKYIRSLNDGYQMSFILPDESISVEEILSDNDTMQEIFSNDAECETCDVAAYIPKFSVNAKFDLVNAVKALGVETIFGLADFEPVIKKEKNSNLLNPYVDEITHEAVVAIDEKGCEAAAYTVITIVDECTSNKFFNANRPFIYYISDTNGTPLFVGVINDPTSK